MRRLASSGEVFARRMTAALLNDDYFLSTVAPDEAHVVVRDAKRPVLGNLILRGLGPQFGNRESFTHIVPPQNRSVFKSRPGIQAAQAALGVEGEVPPPAPDLACGHVG